MRPSPARFPIIGRPPVRMVVALLAAVIAVVAVHRVTSQAAATTARLGPTSAVWVATTDLVAGSVIDADSARLVQRPTAFVPADPVDEPVGRTLSADVGAGEVLVERRMGGAGQEGAAALVPDGWRGLAIPAFDAVLPLRSGQRVDVVAAFDPGLAPPEPALVLVADAVVVHVDDDATATVAVPADRVPAVAFALVTGVVTLALVP